MGNYENLKQSITEVIRTNGNKEITGAVLQSTLLTIISTVGANATFAGIATPTTNPGTPDGSVFYLASEGGTYPNFGNIELQDGLSVLMWNGSWSSQQIFGVDDVPTIESDNLVKSGGVFAANFSTIEFSQSLLKDGEYSIDKNTFGLQSGYYENEDGVVKRKGVSSLHMCIKLNVKGYAIDAVELTDGFSNPVVNNIVYETLSGEIKSEKIQINNRVEIKDDVAILYLNFFSIEEYPDTKFTFYANLTINTLKSGLPLMSQFAIDSNKGITNNALYKLLGVKFSKNGYVNANGIFNSTPEGYWKSTDFVPVVVSDRILYKVKASKGISELSTSVIIGCYDNNKNYLADVSVIPTESGVVEGEYIIPSGVCYIRLSCENPFANNVFASCYCVIDSIMSIKERVNLFINGINGTIKDYLDNFKVNADEIAKEYFNNESDVTLVDSGLTDQYYTQIGTTIQTASLSNLGSLFAINVVPGNKYYIKIMQPVSPGLFNNYFIFAIDNQTAAIPASDIAQYVKSVDVQNYIWEITIPQGCVKVITAGYKNTFGSFWIKELSHENLSWLLINEDNLAESLRGKINEAGQQQEEIAVLQAQHGKTDKTIHLFDSIKKPIVFSGKTLAAFGDSITAGVSSPGLVTLQNDRYISLFCNYVGAIEDNQAISGSCITNGANNTPSIHDKILAYTGNADIIWVAGGVNDWQTQATIGSFDDTTPNTLYGALNDIGDFITQNYPNATVIFVSPIPTTSTTTFGVQHPDNLNDYRIAIQQVAVKYKFNVINGADLGLPDSMTAYGNYMVDNSDKVHPTIAGHALYARSLAGKLL